MKMLYQILYFPLPSNVFNMRGILKALFPIYPLVVPVGGGTSSYEAMLERKRMALRRALKFEYMRKANDPRNPRAAGEEGGGGGAKPPSGMGKLVIQKSSNYFILTGLTWNKIEG